ncbi:hypothetical protein E2C01_020588 [Portunus trituberculatus]|uniref:Uncharacterized protein n=1 Tax=Portunus trituberculatus TaxID=210409 RepID=A0A5B7E251_PORTR|nr:hypothetical protein [Portunus trituberculatus]
MQTREKTKQRWVVVGSGGLSSSTRTMPVWSPLASTPERRYRGPTPHDHTTWVVPRCGGGRRGEMEDKT